MRSRKAAVSVAVGGVTFCNAGPVAFIAGLCALESEAALLRVGRALKASCSALGAGFVLKCSADKANRTALGGFRGPGIEPALKILSRVARRLGVPVLTDVHEPAQAAVAARYADILQIPAFLCRQTEMLLACGRTGKPVNLKKGQFLAPWDMENAVRKIESTGNRRILITERGTTFGYGNLVVDMRSLAVMRRFGYPVIFDATHSVQLPGGLGHATGGERQYAMPLARAAAAVGVAGVFFETHPRPDHALCDGPNTLALKDAPALLRQVCRIDSLVKQERL
ncbi:MAG TPA: 3-deoxy-8-phosphooctulonate synthase [Elusimicrobia bacterium]|nr:3-deoxy-8-phosphooctulonate synthase [Elusimicrobiota bacterium]HBT62762.1 3-deoxy-8-phosphooctulonate synthase [Elusimicrobiota bacterium]